MSTNPTAPIGAADNAPFAMFVDSSELLQSPERLRARAVQDGYLFFRGLLHSDQIVQLRRAILEVLDRHGLLDRAGGPDSDRLDLEQLGSIPKKDMRDDIGVSREIYVELQKLPEFHRLPHDPTLLATFETLFGTDVFVHPRHIMRAMTPHPVMSPTPPHQDFPLVQGSTDTWTCWIPIGDCSLDCGPLAVLRGSHLNGCLPISPGEGAGGIAAQLCEHEDDWMGGSFRVGDVLTFSSLSVHRAVRPTTTGQIRLSMDIRYQPASDVIDASSLGNHADCEWTEIYRDWTDADRDLEFYWTAAHPPISPWDESLLDQSARRIC